MRRSRLPAWVARWDQSLSHVRKLDWNPGQPRGTRGLHFSFSNTHLLWYWLIVVLASPSRAPRTRSWAHSHFQSQSACAFGTLPFTAQSKTTSVNIFLRGRSIIPTPPPCPVNIARCVQFQSGPWNPLPGTSLHSWPDTNKGMKPEGSPVFPAVERVSLGTRLQVPSLKWSL